MEKGLIEQVCHAWAQHQGWPVGKWPRDRRYDAVLITEWVRKLGGPIDFWRDVITQVPKGAHFTLLTTKGPSGATWIENFFINGREQRWAEQKKRFADDAVAIGDILKRMVGK